MHIPDTAALWCNILHSTVQYSTVQYGMLHQLTNTKLTAYCMTASHTYVRSWLEVWSGLSFQATDTLVFQDFGAPVFQVCAS